MPSRLAGITNRETKKRFAALAGGIFLPLSISRMPSRLRRGWTLLYSKPNTAVLALLAGMMLATETSFAQDCPSGGFGNAGLTWDTIVTPCHLNVTVNIPIGYFADINGIPTAKAFKVEAYYNPAYFEPSNTGALQNPIDEDITFGRRLSGTFIVDELYAGTDYYEETLQLVFHRKQGWGDASLGAGIRIRVLEECNGQEVELENTLARMENEPLTFDTRFLPNGINSVQQMIDEDLLPNGTNVSWVVDDELIIDSYGFTLTGSPAARQQIVLLPGARITVTNGQFADNFAVINYTDIFTCADQMAEGIVVESGASLSMEGSTIKDMRYGIAPQASSSLSLVFNAFENNCIGLRLAMDQAPFTVNFEQFVANTFTSTVGLKKPYTGMPDFSGNKGYCGIFVRNYSNLTLNQVIPLFTNNFSNLANGILIFQSNVNLSGMRFSDIGAPGEYSNQGTGIYLGSFGSSNFLCSINTAPNGIMDFNNCQIGIQLNKYSGSIVNTTMDNVTTGIDWINSRRGAITLKDNTITARRFGIRAALNEPFAGPEKGIMLDNKITITGTYNGIPNAAPIGIRVDESGGGNDALSGWQIRSNEVLLKAGGFGMAYTNGKNAVIAGNKIQNQDKNFNSKGIQILNSAYSAVAFNSINQQITAGDSNSFGISEGIYSSAGFENDFSCNCFNLLSTGIQFLDMADFSNRVSTNQFGRHGVGLQLGTEQITTAFIGKQEHTGNEWDLGVIPPGEVGARNFGNTNQSQFIVDGSEKMGRLLPPFAPFGDWFLDDPTEEPTISCSQACDFLPSSPVVNPVVKSTLPTRLDESIVRGDIVYPEFPDEMTWKGAFRVNRKIVRIPELENYDESFSNFVQSESGTSAQMLATVSEGIAALHTFSSAENQLYTTAYENWIASVEAVSALGETLPATDSIVLAAWNSYHAAQSSWENAYNNRQQAIIQRLGGLSTLNSSVVPSGIPDANHKSVNTLILKWLETDSLSESEIVQLYTIASQCPLQGGDAVYEARGLLALWQPEDFDDETLCAAIGSRNQRSNGTPHSVSESIVVFPNPAKNEISWIPGNQEISSVNIINAQGRIVVHENTISNRLPLTTLPSGLYVIQFFNAGNTLLHHASFIIQH